MGFEANSPSSSPSASGSASISIPAAVASPSGKRSRDPEEEVYLDNFHSHKRYLSEIMASSLNGLTVGDSLPDNLMDSPSRSESMFYLRDDISLQYSPMSEDLDDSRYYDTAMNTCSSQPDSPVSPYRYQKPLTTAFSSGCSTMTSSPYPSHGSSTTTASYSRQRGSDSETRFPSSPSDICHSADLRRAALLRSVQIRTQSPGTLSPIITTATTTTTFEMPFGSVVPSIDSEEQRSCSCLKSLDEEREYRIGEECSSLEREKSLG